MNKELIDSIIWWIPIKKVRQKVRLILERFLIVNNELDNLKIKVSELETQIEKNFYFNILLDETVPFEYKKWAVIDGASKLLEYFPNVDNPQTFNDWINWQKLYYRNPDLITVSDKFLFKQYIKDKIGDGYTIPLITYWEKAEDISFDNLPDQFVIKSSNGFGSKKMIIVKDKNSVNINDVRKNAYQWLQPWHQETYNCQGTFPSSEIKPKIIAEEFVSEITEGGRDFSIYASFGKLLFVFVHYDRIFYHNKKIYFCDINWNELELYRPGFEKIYPEKPKRFEEAKEIAQTLSKDFPTMRVDFYDLGDKLLVGELTFAPLGGHKRYNPLEWDYKLGQEVDCTKIKKEHLSKEWIEILENNIELAKKWNYH